MTSLLREKGGCLSLSKPVAHLCCTLLLQINLRRPHISLSKPVAHLCCTLLLQINLRRPHIKPYFAQGLTPLTLAALLARDRIFFHILHIQREVYWQVKQYTQYIVGGHSGQGQNFFRILQSGGAKIKHS